MKMSFKTPLLALLSAALLLGCSSTPSEVEMMADHRASVIEAGLPYKIGPLNVMSAKSDKNVVELLMIYNSSGSVSPTALVDASVKTYCKSNEVRSVLKKGVIYKVTIRSERGQMLVEKSISEQTCQQVEDES
ncbi:type II secretion system pilot lipoprotein GspS-beta [Vibrio sp. CK2-1]|uniref:type II secretion system pilot lipoprotein GspS-beta n=1 Tax=Vibrio sp. CK2-1 TaxID=2912249 RepID=UPI001F399D75|nr:type II secretion system pilot lipoprotein GspS-beta [Vibrio sp. CK2-1]MCF7354876.1 GspS/AspS pilotin family protein [Vibrio sp. CK2-1]